MTDLEESTGTGVPARGASVAAHDHAWRRVGQPGRDEGLTLGEYRCDLCAETWSM